LERTLINSHFQIRPPEKKVRVAIKFSYTEPLHLFECIVSILTMFLKGTSRRAFIAALALGASIPMSMSLNAAATPELLDDTHASVRAVIALQDKVTRDLLKTQGVLGTAVGLDDNGAPSLVIYVDKDDANAAQVQAPAAGNIPVKIELTDKFRALVKPPGSPGKGGGGSGGDGGGTVTQPPTVPHTAKQTLPIQLGTSGGWRYDLANGYCCGGTLGSLVQVNGSQVNDGQYILSNYHVLEADIVSGGNSTIATTGNPVVQPGLIDVGCNAANSQDVGTLVKLGSLPNYNVDVGLAKANAGAVSSSILEIGPISSQTVGASLGQLVKKSGRTTGFTRSKVSGYNATISVSYENECAGGTAFTKTFTGQIVLSNSNSAFLAGGDSGSLMVEDVATNPRAVGLLYAGSSTSAIANPISEVLGFIGSQLGGTATMVGN
jgi:hypothetical protein